MELLIVVFCGQSTTAFPHVGQTVLEEPSNKIVEARDEDSRLSVLTYLEKLSTKIPELVFETQRKQIPSKIVAAYSIQFVFSPVVVETREAENLLLLQTAMGTGQLFTENVVDISGDLLGADCLDLSALSKQLQLCGYDAALASTTSKAKVAYTLRGTPTNKMVRRTDLLIAEIKRIGKALGLNKPRVTCVGAVGSVICALRQLGMEVTATDLNPALVNTYFDDVLVQDGALETARCISNADIALVTGMTLSTFTLHRVVRAANSAGTPIVLFCQSCSNLAPLMVHFPVVSAICESFPFYMFPGDTRIKIFRADEWPA